MVNTPLQPGTHLGKYEVQSLIAVGGMGTVYRAVDAGLGRTVALKVLPAQLARQPNLLERFRREARHAARLSHPHIVTLYEFGHDAEHELYYLAMEYVDGIDLGRYIQRKGQLPPEKARRILFQAARALDHAHQMGVIHRDIKPSNFLMARGGGQVIVKLTDLGLALGHDDDEFKVTREGSTVGTVDYMSPEQARDSRGTDVRSDIYSLGCTAYHMLAGKPPFAEGGLGERVYKHMEAAPPDVRDFNAAVSAAFWDILQKMLAKDPDDRYATPAELVAELKVLIAEASAEAAARPTRAADFSPPPSSGETEAVPRKPRRKKAKPAARPEPDPEPVPMLGGGPGVTPEQVKAAGAFYERAVQVIDEGGGEDYVRQLLTNCLNLDPFTQGYRKTLRDLNGKVSGNVLGRWLGSLNVLALKAKLRAAKASADWRKVLEHGEEVLARAPADAETHIDMAEAATALGVSDLAVWLLEQGREQAPNSVALLRALANLLEQRKDWKRAIPLWEQVRKLTPNDDEPKRKIDELSVKDHLARARYRR